MAYKRVSAGERLRIQADVWNTLQDVAQDHLAQPHKMSGTPLKGVSGFNGIVTVKNSTASHRSRFDIMAITGIAITPTNNLDAFKSRPFFLCGDPEDDSEKMVILQQPIRAGQYGPALIQGVSAVQVDMQDEDHDFAGPTDADPTKLTSAGSGPFRILYVESGTGTKWAAVQWPVGSASISIAKFTGSRTGKRYTGQIVDDDGELGDNAQWLFLNDAGTEDVIDANDYVQVVIAPTWIKDDAAFGDEATYGKKYYAVLGGEESTGTTICRAVSVTGGSGSSYTGTFIDDLEPTGNMSFSLDGYSGDEVIFGSGRKVLVFKIGTSYYATFIPGTYFN